MHTLALLSVLVLSFGAAVHSNPLPQLDELGNANTGNGGAAGGGSVYHTTGGFLGGLRLLDAFSNNAGSGGSASGGDSTLSRKPFGRLGLLPGGAPYRETGNANSGTGGQASGGSVVGDGGALISLFSGNAGGGGIADGGLAGIGGLL